MTREEHLLTILGEECAEVHQRCSKALRFGMREVGTGQDKKNSDRIVQEFNDLLAMMEMVFDVSIEFLIDIDQMNMKKAKVEKFLKYSKECGTLS